MDANKVQEVSKQLLSSNLNLNKTQVAGLVGGLVFESQLKTSARNSINAQGIAQWLGTRRDHFKSLKGKQLMEATLKEQVDYIIYELNGPESRALSKLKTASTVEEAARIADRYYERSEGTDKILRGKADYAKRVYEII